MRKWCGAWLRTVPENNCGCNAAVLYNDIYDQRIHQLHLLGGTMNVILKFVRDYFIFMLILFLFSYLVPKDTYKKYVQFFIGVLMVAILMQPVVSLFTEDGEDEVRSQIEQIMEECTKGGDLYERLYEAAGVDTENSGETE